MRSLILSLISLVVLVDLAWSQTIDLTSPNPGLPVYRPALVGSAPSSLVNKIDSAALAKKGQKDAAVMFVCTVTKSGDLSWSATYRGTPNSKLLDEEVRNRLLEVKFIPAVYNHTLVDAMYFGTVTFAILDGKPRLRIFSNQEAGELKKESDFVGPQPYYGMDSKFDGFHYPTEQMPVMVKGAVELKVKVDAAGNLKEIKVTDDAPPFVGFGDAALFDFRGAKFIPAFRDGKPVACEVSLPIYYIPRT